ncbi:MAG: peptide chain release factor 1 [Acetobacteraceae bacterium]
MTDAEYGRKLDELDRLINDPEVPIQPDRVWSLLAELASREHRSTAPRRASVRKRLD